MSPAKKRSSISRAISVRPSQFGNCFIDSDQIVAGRIDGQFTSSNSCRLPAAVPGDAFGGRCRSDAPHGLGRGGEEVSAAVPLGAAAPPPSPSTSANMPHGPGRSPVESDPPWTSFCAASAIRRRPAAAANRRLSIAGFDGDRIRVTSDMKERIPPECGNRNTRAANGHRDRRLINHRSGSCQRRGSW